MTVESQGTSQRRAAPWPARARFTPGKTRRQRQDQYRQQTTAIITVLSAALVLGVIFVVANWQNAGAARTVSCEQFPDFCVPFAGGSASAAALEAPAARTLDAESSAAPGVVRYVDQNNVVTLGDPNAPIHFVTVSDYACPHCQTFHDSDVPRFIDEYVRTGQATFGFVLATGTGRIYSELASQGALCAGEQGAFWEYSDEMFRLARSSRVDQAFTLGQLRDSAGDMGLDSQQLTECLTSNRYLQFLNQYRVFISDNGVTGTPTVLASYGDSNQWRIVQRDFSSLAQLTEAANGQ